jgi:crotonobetainyl-CoA:carnitine CoA-transferase CaiB-like acyl-CoA transferase
MPGPLTGIRVFDLSRILAGPSCAQMLGDLGADVIKVERPGTGDDTRRWGPPYALSADGTETSESAYYLSANRNKRSIALDIATAEGQSIARRLIARSDILIENFKTGDLKRHGLDFAALSPDYPGLIYCSITGFGQDGPNAGRAGYDYMAQAMSGLMSATGAPDTAPVRVGVAIADILTGMYAGNAILAALHHRDKTGRGQYIDLGLLDCQMAGLSNIGQYFLTTGENPPRLGNGHPAIVPYDSFECSDGWSVFAIGNDEQFRKLCDFAAVPELVQDPRFATNDARVRHHEILMPILRDLVRGHSVDYWVTGGTHLGFAVGPINTIGDAFADPQVRHRGMEIALDHPLTAAPVHLIASPIKMSETPASYRYAPPVLGQHSDEILAELLGLSEDEIAALRERGVV